MRIYKTSQTDVTKPRAREKGFTMIMFVASSTVMLGFVGLAIDVGFEMHQKRHMQTAADAAVISAAYELMHGTTYSVTAAQNDASLNGFTNGSNGTTVTVSNPPTSGSYAGDSSYVQVVIAQPQPTFFLRVFNYNSMAVSAKATAQIGGGSGGACIFLLHPTFQGAYYTDGGTTVTSTCGMKVNSNDSQKAINNQGSTTMAGTIQVVGGVTNQGTLSPTPSQITGPVTDPLASLAVPTTSGLTVRANSTTSLTGTVTINPGVYNGGISIGQGANVTMNPGLYYLNNGGLFLTQASLTGSGVTIFLTGSQGTTPVLADSVSTMTLSAPTSSAGGAIEGILFFLDRNSAYANLNWGIDIQSNGVNKFEGVLYFPTSGVLWQSQSSASIGNYTIIVAQNLRIDGSGTRLSVNSNYSSLTHGNPLKGSITLAE